MARRRWTCSLLLFVSVILPSREFLAVKNELQVPRAPAPAKFPTKPITIKAPTRNSSLSPQGQKHSKRPFLAPSPSPNLRPTPKKPRFTSRPQAFSATLKRVRNYLLQIKSRSTPAIPLHGSYKTKSAIETGIEEARGGKGKGRERRLF
ncbi:hypothetical protein DL98DRAFT_537875 [Cadophora sp. DSE1049]|nr:hypothetical protein DL98DRAFT_537875 [Cadophora sp. DSE1049]